MATHEIFNDNRINVCTEKLQLFVMHLHRYSKQFKQQLDELQRTASRLETLLKNLNVLENLTVEDNHIYPTSILEQIISKIICEQSQLFISGKRCLSMLQQSFVELSTAHKQFIASTNRLDQSPNCPLFSGSAKQKPLDYYVDKSNIIVLYMKVFQHYLDNQVIELELRKSSSYQHFADALRVSDDFQMELDDFLLYSHFLRIK